MAKVAMSSMWICYSFHTSHIFHILGEVGCLEDESTLAGSVLKEENVWTSDKRQLGLGQVVAFYT
jgi:hypothetical protein